MSFHSLAVASHWVMPTRPGPPWFWQETEKLGPKPGMPSAVIRASSITSASIPSRIIAGVMSGVPWISCAVARGFGCQHRRIQAAVVEHRTDLVAGTGGLACLDDMFLDVGKDREIVTHRVEGQRLVAIRRRPRRDHVILRTRPPDTDELVHRIADVGRFLNRHLVHHAPAVHDHVVGPVAPDLQPLRLLLLTGVIDRNEAQLETMLLGQLLQRPDRLLAIGGVVIDQRDLLAIEVAAVLAEQVVDRPRGPVPVVGGVVEHMAEDLAIGRRGASVTHGVHRNIIRRGLGDQLVGDARRQRLIDQRAFALGGLIALDALLGVVSGLAFHDTVSSPRRCRRRGH